MRRILAYFWTGLLLVSLAGCAGDTNAVAPPSLTPRTDAEILSSVMDGQMRYYVTDEGIRRENSLTGENTLLTTADNPSHLQCIDGYVFYIAGTDGENFALWRIHGTGGTPETVFSQRALCGDEGTQVNDWCFHNGRYYVQVNLQLFMYDPATEQGDIVNNDVGAYVLDGNTLYHIDHASRTFTIYRTDLTTGEREILMGDGTYEDKPTTKTIHTNLCLLDGVLYYTTRQPIGLYRFENGQSTLISNSDTIDEFSLSTYAGRLYFMERTDGEDVLREYNPITGSIQKVATVTDYNRALTVKEGCFFYYAYDPTTGEQILRRLPLKE